MTALLYIPFSVEGASIEVEIAPEGRPFEGCLNVLVVEGVADIGSAVDRDDLGIQCKTVFR